MIFYGLWILTIAGVATNLWFGGRIDRLATAVIVVGTLLTPFFYEARIGGFRWAIAVIDVVGFLCLTALSFSRQRWWLVPLAGFQLVSVVTHVVAALESDLGLWSTATIRMVTWCGVILSLLAGAYEARIVQRYDLWRMHNGQARPR